MYGTAFTLARVWGIPIRLHISLVVMLVIVATLGGMAGGWMGLLWTVSLTAAVFASIVLHELAHSLVALQFGCRVRSITLLFIGGAAQMQQMPRRAWQEFLMAAAGPALSLGLWALLGRVSLVLTARGDAPMLAELAYLLARANGMLALFNLIPAFPMDGGRLLRAALTPRMGRLRATYIASRLGRTLAFVLGFSAALNLFALWDVHLPFLNRVMFVAIALFVFRAAGAEYRSVQRENRMGGQSGGFPWPFGIAPEPPPLPEDEVEISPPPFRKGPPQRSELKVDRPGRW